MQVPFRQSKPIMYNCKKKHDEYWTPNTEHMHAICMTTGVELIMLRWMKCDRMRIVCELAQFHAVFVVVYSRVHLVFVVIGGVLSTREKKTEQIFLWKFYNS